MSKEKKNTIHAENMAEKQRKQKEEQAVLARKQEEEARKAYEEQLRQEKLELIRLKQGVIEESTTIHEETPELQKHSIWQRIGNFFYHNKWWLWLACFFVFLVGYLVWQIVTTVHPDLIVLLVVDDDTLNYGYNASMCELFRQYTEDVNGDGKVVAEVYYMPASERISENDGYTGDMTKLFAEFQISEAVIVISDADADKYIVPDSTLYDLEADFGQYAQTDKMRFYLSDTDFANDIGWTEGKLDEDIYIGIRSVRKTMDSEEEMQEVFDNCYPVLKQFITHYGTQK